VSRAALVTGAGRGIGHAIAQRLVEDGFDVLACDLEPDAEGPGVPYAADLATREGNRDAVAAALSSFGRLDAVVANAGLQHVAPIEEFPPEVFARMMTIMVEAPFRIVRRALPGMYERGWGRIVNISSVHGLRASPYKAAYVTAKHALEGLSKVIALEGATHGVTSNCVNPSYVRTPLVENQIADQARTHDLPPDEVVERIMLEPAAIKRLVEPEEVAELVAYLCSPQASMMTGASVTLDGGWSVH
jgi:3-hydroxybutyrate dehydrogenase